MHDKWSRTVCNHMLTRRLKQHTRRRRKPDSRSGNWLDQKTRQANKNKQLEATPVRAYEAGNMNKKRITDFMYWSINCLTQIVVSKVAAACSTTSPPIYYYENSWMTRRQHHLCWSCRPAGWRKKKPSPGPAVQLGAEERRYHHLVLLTSWVKKEDIYIPSSGPVDQLGEERRYHHLVLLTSWVKKEDTITWSCWPVGWRRTSTSSSSYIIMSPLAKQPRGQLDCLLVVGQF